MTDKHVLCLSEKGMIIFALVLKAHTAEAEIDIIVTKVYAQTLNVNKNACKAPVWQYECRCNQSLCVCV